MRPLKAAVIGLGVGEQHLAGYRRHPRCEVVALCDLDPEKRSMARERYPETRVSADPVEILASPDVDVVSIASFDDAHAEQVIQALGSGKHVFAEKPLCQTHEQLRAVKHAWSQHGGAVKLGCNLVLRAAPAYCWLKQELETGLFGEVFAFDGDYLFGRLHKITEGWRKDVENYSVMEGGGIHLVDLFVWLTGARPRSVVAMGNRLSTRDTAFRYEDFVAATMQCASGLVARISANFGCVHRHQHVVRLFGTQGTFLYDDAGPRWHASRDPAVAATPVSLATLPSSKSDLLPAFIDAILENRDIGADTQSHFDVMSICLASDDSLRNNSPQEVQYV